MFQGFAELDSVTAKRLLALFRSSTFGPVDLDDLPSYRVYGPDGLVVGQVGSCSLADSGSVTGASNTTPIVITSSSHGLSDGTTVTVEGVGGNTAANGTFTVANATTDTFELEGSAGNGSYTSGGSWHVTGLYLVSLSVTGNNGYDAAQTYQVLVSGLVGGLEVAEMVTFAVN
jgi:hypothetical protein